MTEVFLKIFNMSIMAGWIALAVIMLRLLLKKVPKWISCLLWVLVGVRLVCPFSFQSVLSLIPSTETIPKDALYSAAPSIDSGIPIVNEVVNPIIAESFTPNVSDSVNPMQILLSVAAVIWIVGIAGMLAYAVVSFIRISRRVRECVEVEKKIFICDRIDTPFILGIVRPRIFLPSAMSETDMEYVLAHERAHLKRYDHLWKPLGFLLLSVYWFNPILWVAYVLLCRDIELACDERVIRQMGVEVKRPYSEALINCSMPRKMISACPLAFGEVSVKGRIKSVLNYKKPAFWIIIVAVVVSVVAAVCFLTDPLTDKEALNSDDSSLVLGSSVLSGSELEGVSLSLVNFDMDIDKPIIRIKWTNDRDSELVIGKSFDLMFDYNGEFRSCAVGDVYHQEMAYVIPAKSTAVLAYDTWAFDLTQVGKYRFVAEYSGCKLWIEFEMVSTPDSYSPTTSSSPSDSSDSTSSTIKPPANIVNVRKLALQDVIELSKKGDELTYKGDLERYLHYDIGSGVMIYYYEIDEMFALFIGNISVDGKPGYMHLKAYDGSGEMIDIRESDVEAFINRHKNNEVVERRSYEMFNSRLVIGYYEFKESDDAIPPTVVLKNDGSFYFILKAESSYLGRGQYTYKDGILYLETDDGQYYFTFKLKDSRLIFDADNSSEFIWNPEIKDGAVFE